MKTFMKDYMNLCKVTGKFYKDHWKGLIVMNVVTGVTGFAVICKDEIKDKVKSKFHKEEESK